MGAKQLLSLVLTDDALTRGLADPEARILVEWLVAQIEHAGADDPDSAEAHGKARRLCRRGRSISRFVGLWCHGGARGAALQLACTERFHWPLPTTDIDPCELMQSIVDWETQTNALAVH